MASDKDGGKKHQVFARSFDGKLTTTNHLILEKLNHIHNNPCNGVGDWWQIRWIANIVRQSITSGNAERIHY